MNDIGYTDCVDLFGRHRLRMPIALWLLNMGCTGKEEPVPNVIPTITIINPADGDLWTENDEVQMLAQVLDDDHFAMDLLVQWSIDGEVICEWSTS